jgi:GT2 family glycosyltransferase
MQIKTMLSLAFLQHISVKAIPLRGLIKKANNHWVATDNNSQFQLKHPLFNVISGKIRIRIKMESSSLSPSPKIYYAFKEGYLESQSVEMHLIDDVYQADIVLSKAPKYFRFDPNVKEGNFRLTQIIVNVPIPWIHLLPCLFGIMKDDYLEEKDILKIIRKSHVRYKKHGIARMLERLEKDCIKFDPAKYQRGETQHIAYLNWMKKYESLKEQYNDTLYSYKPHISIITPTYNTNVKYLKEMLESVLAQTYPYWELCIADDASITDGTREILQDYAAKYNNIKVVFRKSNGHISEASNSALSLASGDYVIFLDDDDMLASNALYEMVKKLNENRTLKFIYSDEDKIDELSLRYDPHFKSSWNPDMFFSHNYINHLTCIKKEIVDTIGGFRKGYEGSQDYDLFLRVLKHLKESEIAHIPKILYHWRAIKDSTAYDNREKIYTHEAGRKALENYFEENINVEDGMVANTYKVNYPLPDTHPLVSILIPTRDGYEILSKCVESILKKTTYQNYEILILDNETTCPKTLAYFDTLTKYKNIHILAYPYPFNYSAINNFGVRHAKGDIIALLNNDVEIITDHWLIEMVSHAIRSDIGAVGAMLYYDNDTIQHAGVVLGIGGVAGYSHKYFKKGAAGYFSRLKVVQNFSAVTAACLVVKKDLYQQVGGLDEEQLTVAFNDVDFCLKLQNEGYRNLWTPYVELYHHESVSRGEEDNKEKRKRFSKEVIYMKKQWKSILNNDRYYNANLTLKDENFGVNVDG